MTVIWSDIDQLIVHGSRVHEEVVFFHRDSATLILADLIENVEAAQLPGWFRPIVRRAGVLEPDGRMPVDMRLTFWRGRPALRAAVHRMLAWKPKRVIVVHGRWYQHNAVEELQRALKCPQ